MQTHSLGEGGEPGAHGLILQATGLSLPWYFWIILHLASERGLSNIGDEINGFRTISCRPSDVGTL